MKSAIFLASILLVACTADTTPDRSDAEYQRTLTADLKATVALDLAEVVAGARTLQAAAPAPVGRGWDATGDAAAIATMKSAWLRCRVAYDHVQGAMAALYPELATSLDARYDDFLASLHGAGDSDAFDGDGITGLRAIERILYADVTPARVVDLESLRPGYLAAALPRTEDEALEFRTKLVRKLLDDATALQSRWNGATVTAGTAYTALAGLINTPLLRLGQAGAFEEESRYAQVSLLDLRHNLQGQQALYATFRPWILSRPDGAAADDHIQASFAAAGRAYAAVKGDALPVPPDTWSENPSKADLATPFGALWTGVRLAFSPAQYGTLGYELGQLGPMLGLAPQ